MISRLFSFSGWSKDHPSDQIPGDSLDAEFDRVRAEIEALDGKIGRVLRSDGALRNAIVTKDALEPAFFDKIVQFFKKQVEDDLNDAKTARNVAESSATTAVIAKNQAESASARAVSAASIAETGAGSLITELSAARGASVSLLDHIGNAHAAFNNATIRSADAEELSAQYAELSSLWAEYMPDAIPPNKLAAMDISGDHWSSRWWANQAANAWGKMSDLYLGAHPSPPTETATHGPIPLGAVYYNTATNQTYIWNGSQWVSFWRPQKAVTASLYYTLASDLTEIAIGSTEDDFGQTFLFDDVEPEGVEVFAGPTVEGALRLKPYASTPGIGDSGGYYVVSATNTILFGEALPSGSLVVIDCLASPESLRPGSVDLYQLRSFDYDPDTAGTGYQDGVRTVFPLARNDGGGVAAASSEELMVYVNGVAQQPGIDFTLTAPAEITFAVAPEADARTWAIWAEPIGGAGEGTEPPPPIPSAHHYFGWNPASGVEWYDARGLARTTPNEASREALVQDVDIVTGSVVIQQDTRELWIYDSSEGIWRLLVPTLPDEGVGGLFLTFDGTSPTWAEHLDSSTHGDLPGGTLHALATISSHGFMSSADKAKLDSVPLGGSGGASVTIGDSPPVSPAIGALWHETDTGNLYIWLNDGTSTQWVPATAQVGVGSGGGGGEPVITPGTTAQYWRGDKTWQTLPAAGIADAVSDGNTYARMNAAWVEIPGLGGLATTEYTLSATTTPPPGTNNIRLNNATQTAVTTIYLHDINAVNVDVSRALAMLRQGNVILIQDKANAANYQYYTVSAAVTDSGTYTTVPVAWVSGGSPCTAGRIMLAAFGLGVSEEVVGGLVTIASSAPSSPAVNDVWIDTT